MADADLRDLERRAALGDVEAGVQFLRARIQTGGLSALDVRLLACRQDPAAVALERATGFDRASFARRVAARRAALSEEEREALDRAFYRAFLAATGRESSSSEGEPPALAELRTLLERGAGTGAFDDHELGPGNVGSVVKDWLSGAWRPSDADMAEALGLCLEAGPAFVTNRGYVGNGGVPAVWFVFEWLGESPDAERLPYVRGLLEAMCAAAAPQSRFWRDFVHAFVCEFLMPLARAGTPLSEGQEWAARFALKLALDPPDLETGLEAWRSAPHFDCVATAGRALIGIGDLGLFDLAFELAKAKVGVFDGSPVTFEAGERILKGALSGGRGRATLEQLIRRSPWLRDQAFRCPALVFSLVRRRERKLLTALLSVDRERMRALRDEAGNDLLLAACATKGRTVKLVELLLSRGFDPAINNARGEGALELATRVRNEKLIALLSAR